MLWLLLEFNKLSISPKQRDDKALKVEENQSASRPRVATELILSISAACAGRTILARSATTESLSHPTRGIHSGRHGPEHSGPYGAAGNRVGAPEYLC